MKPIDRPSTTPPRQAIHGKTPVIPQPNSVAEGLAGISPVKNNTNWINAANWAELAGEIPVVPSERGVFRSLKKEKFQLWVIRGKELLPFLSILAFVESPSTLHTKNNDCYPVLGITVV
ncbi:hypothetical protein [Bacillus sp. 3255]|uniref:hypothetical protein n=1 Tax=Bacillus sp. 3255 TaxID=2817904 RepID=UPI00286D4EE2|nr:hypothetical protein [Bacillus sp. 3255]